MVMNDHDVPRWPTASAIVRDDGSAELTMLGHTRTLTTDSPAGARTEIVRLVHDTLVDALDRPVRLTTVDPDGSQGELAIHPDGAVTELARRRGSRGSLRRRSPGARLRRWARLRADTDARTTMTDRSVAATD